jgi:hypothetical protein
MAGYGAIFVSAIEVRENVERGEIARVNVQEVDLVNPIVLCRRLQDELSPAAEHFRQLVLRIYHPKGRKLL